VTPDDFVQRLPVAAGLHAQHQPSLRGHEGHLLVDVATDDAVTHFQPAGDVLRQNQDRVDAEESLGQ
jgi:hypothetical protein